jgi:hypothetical protein
MLTNIVKNHKETNLRALICNQMTKNIHFSNQLELTPSGKFRVTISKITGEGQHP